MKPSSTLAEATAGQLTSRRATEFPPQAAAAPAPPIKPFPPQNIIPLHPTEAREKKEEEEEEEKEEDECPIRSDKPGWYNTYFYFATGSVRKSTQSPLRRPEICRPLAEAWQAERLVLSASYHFWRRLLTTYNTTVRMEQRRNARARETEDPEKIQLNISIVRHDSHMPNSGSDPSRESYPGLLGRRRRDTTWMQNFQQGFRIVGGNRERTYMSSGEQQPSQSQANPLSAAVMIGRARGRSHKGGRSSGAAHGQIITLQVAARRADNGRAAALEEEKGGSATTRTGSRTQPTPQSAWEYRRETDTLRRLCPSETNLAISRYLQAEIIPMIIHDYDYSSPIKANRVRFPVASHPDFRTTVAACRIAVSTKPDVFINLEAAHCVLWYHETRSPITMQKNFLTTYGKMPHDVKSIKS
ncbi:hypothetical protein PR048_000829 [Dryococelus australis]|uniref:Uncharacterized protein n=1 Tax=Dryococelus australis TaxID=614101 RepID=A0ABQ9IFQ6_9NEOP|nr:hypothetical protein PR048_000829 [Dryococelus australis]